MASSIPVVADELYSILERGLKAASADKSQTYKAIVELPFEHTKEMALLSMGFLCYFSIDRQAGQLKLENATRNDYYTQSVETYDFDYSAFVLPLTAVDNSIVKAALSKEIVSLTDWDKLRRPAVEEGVARLNQATSGIAYTMCAPIGDIGVLGFNFFQPKEVLSQESEDFVVRYSQLVSAALNEA